MSILDKYKAKLDGISIEQHTDEVLAIKEQIATIYNLNEKMRNSLHKSIKSHDVGKVVDSFQNNIEGKHRTVRHEVLSASIKGLLDEERLAIITHHKEIQKLIENIENEYYEDELKEMSQKLNIEVEDIRGFIKKISRSSNKLVKDLNAILLKGYLQYCDHVASSGIKHIEKGFDAVDKFRFNKLNSIQKEVLNLNKQENVMIIGPTGVGKTATSLYWSNLMQNNENSKRIYYLLPYTASINALYKDMISKDISTSMMHSRVEYFLDKMDVENTKEMQNMFRKSVKQLNISTIYQIIKAVFSCKRFEMLLAQLKDSIFIIDEIHCFDIEQLGLLLTTLKFLKDKLNVSICIMSASIPTNLQELICKELDIKKIIKASKEDYLIRHRLYRINKNILDDLDKIKNDLDNNKQVIVCVNSVNLAQELYLKLKDYGPKLIHSRFNVRDREKAEQNIKDSRLLIGTQAIEVSLDISYDVMYTEIAPFDSLQQRFGRVNRRGEKGVSDIFIYDVSNKIYNEKLIERTDFVIKEIIEKDNRIVLENKTQEYLDKVYIDIDIESYNKTCKKIDDVIKTLRVATFNKSATDDLCSSNTISVLPRVLLDEYLKLMEDKKYLEANSLFVNIGAYMIKYVTRINDIYVVDFVYDERGLVYESCTQAYFI